MPKKKIVKDKPVVIEWVDACDHNAWGDGKQDVAIVRSMGFIISETPAQIVLARDKGTDPKDTEPYGAYIAIPRENVIKRKALKI